MGEKVERNRLALVIGAIVVLVAVVAVIAAVIVQRQKQALNAAHKAYAAAMEDCTVELGVLEEGLSEAEELLLANEAEFDDDTAEITALSELIASTKTSECLAASDHAGKEELLAAIGVLETTMRENTTANTEMETVVVAVQGALDAQILAKAMAAFNQAISDGKNGVSAAQSAISVSEGCTTDNATRETTAKTVADVEKKLAEVKNLDKTDATAVRAFTDSLACLVKTLGEQTGAVSVAHEAWNAQQAEAAAATEYAPEASPDYSGWADNSWNSGYGSYTPPDSSWGHMAPAPPVPAPSTGGGFCFEWEIGKTPVQVPCS